MLGGTPGIDDKVGLTPYACVQRYSAQFFRAMETLGKGDSPTDQELEWEPVGVAFYWDKRLSRPATLGLSEDLCRVLECCDGTRTADAIAQVFSESVDDIQAAAGVRSAIDDLRATGLLS